MSCRSAVVLRTRLALCVSAVAVYGIASGEWAGAVQEVAQRLGEQSADSARAMCDVLSELAEDAREPQMALSSDERNRVAAQLSNQLPYVLDTLQRTIGAAGGHAALHKSALSCLCSWWKNVQWRPPVVLAHPVLDSAFAALSSAELDTAASQAVLELIRGVDDFCLPPYQHSPFDYWDGEEGELDGRLQDGQANGAAAFALTDEQLAAQQAVVHRVTALVPMYSQTTHQHAAGSGSARIVSCLLARLANSHVSPLYACCMVSPRVVLCCVGGQRRMWHSRWVSALVCCVSCSPRWANHCCVTSCRSVVQHTSAVNSLALRLPPVSSCLPVDRAFRASHLYQAALCSLLRCVFPRVRVGRALPSLRWCWTVCC